MELELEPTDLTVAFDSFLDLYVSATVAENVANEESPNPGFVQSDDRLFFRLKAELLP